jgi:predicted dehydrogenase
VLNIGILGAAGIAPAAVIRPASRRDDVEILAVSSRSQESADRYAQEHGIERAYGDYPAMLADPDIDLVYNALPPSGHAEWSIAALEAGKDVLCEKPFAMTAKQARRMTDAATSTGRRLIEAFHDRYHPLSLELDAIHDSGRLGDILSIEADFLATNSYDPASLRHDPKLGGGALMDLGCYPLHWVRAFMRSEPTVVSATATRNPSGADMSITAALEFAGGTQATVGASMEHEGLVQAIRITGSHGTLHVEGMVFPSRGHSIREEVDGVTREWTVGGQTSYDHQLDAVVRGLASGEPLPTEGEDSVATMELIDGIYAKVGISLDFE